MSIGGSFQKTIQEIISRVPESKIEIDADRPAQLRSLSSAASWKAAGVSGALSIPGGPFFLVTILPDLALVWRIQAQLVADIARVQGRTDQLSSEILLYCLFKQGDLGLSDIVVRVGERYLVKRARGGVLQRLIERVGVRVLRRWIGKRAAAIIPLIGAAAVARYSRKDTLEVAETAIHLFSRPWILEDEEGQKEPL